MGLEPTSIRSSLEEITLSTGQEKQGLGNPSRSNDEEEQSD